MASELKRSDLEVYRLGDQTKIKNNRHEDTETLRRAPDETLLKGRYKIVRPITTTGFSQTFLAEDVLLPSNRKCIIKQFAYASSDSQNVQMMLERFIREFSYTEDGAIVALMAIGIED